MADKNVGDKITVLADAVLGTPEAQATILEVYEDTYLVHVDGDPQEEVGLVDHAGNIVGAG